MSRGGNGTYKQARGKETRTTDSDGRRRDGSRGVWGHIYRQIDIIKHYERRSEKTMKEWNQHKERTKERNKDRKRRKLRKEKRTTRDDGMSISKANIQAGRTEWYIVAFYVEFWALACTVADGNDSRALHCPNYDSTGAMHYYSFLCDVS